MQITGVDWNNLLGLADANNFYASCERVFNPSLIGKPVIVLSNNDGCVIARSNEAKKLGIKMGHPAFELTDLIRRENVNVFSSNFTLYNDMSVRVMGMLSGFVPQIEVYSIDECFLNFRGMLFHDLNDYGYDVVRKVTQGTGIPVSLGLAPSKTLSKIANKFAKKFPGYRGVCLIDNEHKLKTALQLTEIGDVWGIGRQYARRLTSMGIKTAYDFAELPSTWVRKNMTVVGERMWRELHGWPCLDITSLPPDKKEICVSRSFGDMVSDYKSVSEAIATFTVNSCHKLRDQDLCARAVKVFLHTNQFREDLPQYARNIIIKLPVPSSSTLEIMKYTLRALRIIFADGYKYKKAGVILTGLVSNTAIQSNLFDKLDRQKHDRLMSAWDNIVDRYGRRALIVANQGGEREEWTMKQQLLSPHYTTRMEDFIRCG